MTGWAEANAEVRHPRQTLMAMFLKCFVFILIFLFSVNAHPPTLSKAYSAISVSNAHTIEVRRCTSSIGDRVTRRAGLADNVALNGGEDRLRRQIGDALKEIRSR